MQNEMISIDPQHLSSITGAITYWTVKNKAELDALVASANRAEQARLARPPFMLRVLETAATSFVSAL